VTRSGFVVRELQILIVCHGYLEKKTVASTLNYHPQRVFGGEKTNPGMFPFTALLGYQVYKMQWVEQFKAWRNRTTLDYECGGTLINKWFVLTAAHCHQRRKPIASVRLGDWWVGNGKMQDCDQEVCLPPVQDFDITSADVIVHEDFRFSHSNVINDIALIRLPRKAELNLGVQIVCLPLKAAEFTKELNVENLQKGLEGNYPNVVGWGYSKDYDPYNDAKQGDFETNNVATAYQQRLDVQVISSSECFQRLDVETLDTQLCAGGRVGQDACKGDSGGPLYLSHVSATGQSTLDNTQPWYLVGVVSFGAKRCGNGNPGVYTRVQSFIPWIESQIGHHDL